MTRLKMNLTIFILLFQVMMSLRLSQPLISIFALLPWPVWQGQEAVVATGSDSQ